MSDLRDALEAHQVITYFAAVLVGATFGVLVPSAAALESAINPALALMLFVTFLQVPLAELGRAFVQARFLGALTAANFVATPILVFGLLHLLPDDPLVRLGVLFVLLTPCIDYVVTFAHIGRADSRILLASTPVLLVLQMVLLPVYLSMFLGEAAAGLVHLGPFVHAFAWLIAMPLAAAAAVQFAAGRVPVAVRLSDALGLLPVPATALVLFVVIASVTPQVGAGLGGALKAVPVYIAYAAAAPLVGWAIARLAGLGGAAGRAVAFSAGTRNSLVVLPLAFAVPGAMPVLPAVIVAQTLVELVASLAYMRLIPKLGGNSREA